MPHADTPRRTRTASRKTPGGTTFVPGGMCESQKNNENPAIAPPISEPVCAWPPRAPPVRGANRVFFTSRAEKETRWDGPCLTRFARMRSLSGRPAPLKGAKRKSPWTPPREFERGNFAGMCGVGFPTTTLGTIRPMPPQDTERGSRVSEALCRSWHCTPGNGRVGRDNSTSQAAS